MPKDYIVIDIGTQNIKMIEASFEKQNIMLKNFSIIPTPLDSFENGNILDSESLAEIIKEELRTAAYKAKSTIVLVTGDSTIDREVILPKMTEKELKKVIEFEADQYFPVNLINYTVDFKIIEEVTTQEGSKYKVLVVAVPKEIIDGYVNVIEKCGLRLEVIDIAANALTKIVDLETKLRSNGQSDSFALIDLGAAVSRVVIIDNGKFRFERIIKIGVNDLISIIVETLNIKFKNAEELLRQKFADYIKVNQINGSDNDEVQKIGSQIVQTLNILCDEVNKLLQYYRSRNSENNINKLLLTGGGVHLNGIDKYIGQNVGIISEHMQSIKSVINKSSKDILKKEEFLIGTFGGIIRTDK